MNDIDRAWAQSIAMLIAFGILAICILANLANNQMGWIP